MKTEYKSKCNNYKLEIIQDESPESPNDWGDSSVFLVYDHHQFHVKRNGFKPGNIFKHLRATENINQLEQIIKDGYDLDDVQLENLEYYQDCLVKEYNNYFIFPVSAYIHSGVSLSITNEFFSDEWDSSIQGFVLVEKVLVKDEVTDEITNIAKNYAEELIETWNTYLSGDVWGFKLYKAQNFCKISEENWDKLVENSYEFKAYQHFIYETEWNEIDSCWGFYGSNIEKNSMLAHIDSKIEFEF